MKFVWRKHTDSIGCVQYSCVMKDEHGDTITHATVYKGYNTRYKRVMYSYQSAYRTTLKEIKKYVEVRLKPKTKNQEFNL